jgi:hypothetical protein
MYYRRTRRLDTPLVTDIRVAPEPAPEDVATGLQGWIKAEDDLHSGLWPTQPEMRLWYKLQTTDMVKFKRQEAYETQDIITELDVVYGDDAPFFGFQRAEGGKVVEAKDGKWESVGIAYKRGNPGRSHWSAVHVADLRPVPPKAEVPTLHPDGTLKILQSGYPGILVHGTPANLTQLLISTILLERVPVVTPTRCLVPVISIRRLGWLKHWMRRSQILLYVTERLKVCIWLMMGKGLLWRPAQWSKDVL